MRIVKLTPKANDDLTAIWDYGQLHFGKAQADKYIDHISEIFQILSIHDIGTARRELGEGIFSLPFERHILYFLQTEADIIIIRILGQSQDVNRHLHWQ